MLLTAGVPVEASHPLPGVLRQILDVKNPTVSFLDAHKFKRLLDDAVNWESPAKKQLQQITKGIRGTIREIMAGHAPYDEATAAYANAIPLFTKGVVRQVTRQAVENPELLVRTIKGHEPTKLQMLKDVLLSHAERGGGPEGAAEGQAAWDSVRAAWTREHLIKDGIEQFGPRLEKLDPEFVDVLYGDGPGKQVLGNLQQIHQAWQDALAREASGETADKAAIQTLRGRTAQTAEQGRLRVQQASDRAADIAAQGRAVVSHQQGPLAQARYQARDLRQLTPDEVAFRTSSLAAPPSQTSTLTDIVHMGLPGHGYFKLASTMRLLLRGPKGQDLVEWAAYSPQGTQMLVHALTSATPGMAVADLMRTAGIVVAERNAPGEKEWAARQGGRGQALTPPPTRPISSQGPPPARP